MAHVNPPYFFDEFQRPVSRKAPSERERALGFSIKDLDWLLTLYYATDAARQNKEARGYPMKVERLLVNLSDKPAIVLAGTFIMSPTPDDAKAVLFTPCGGLELFDSRADLLEGVEERLKQPGQRAELLQFLAIDERDALSGKDPLTVSTAAIPGAVMADQRQGILDAQQKNVAAMLDQLRKLPTLRWMLDTLLNIMARRYFPSLDQSDTWVDFLGKVATDEEHRLGASMPLREALLQFYVRQGWPKDQTRTFTNLGHDASQRSAQQRAKDQQDWDSLVVQTSGTLSTLLHSLLQTYWHEDYREGQSRLQFFARVISDKFRVDLLFKRQDLIVSTEESQTLHAVFLADQAARRAYPGTLKIEKVQVHAPYQHYVELASTLLISNSHAYLYTQSRGLQVLKNVEELKDTLQAMLKAAGHEDELLNFLSLDERSVFIDMDQVQVTGKPVAGDVFQDMIKDIAAKQFSNLEHALGLYRRSAGGINLGALLDTALDIRIMLDSRLMEQDAGGHWSVHPVTSGNGRPSTVLAEKARLRLKRMGAVHDALALERSKQVTLRDLAAHALDAELAKGHTNLKANDVYLNTYPTLAEERERRVPELSLGMVEHFIARLARQADALTESAMRGFYGKPEARVALKWSNLTVASFNTVIDKVLSGFVDKDLRTLPHLLIDNNKAHLAQGLFDGLSGEAHLRRLSRTLGPTHVALLDSVLNNESMTRLTRHGLNGFIPDAYGLSLSDGTRTDPLASCFVLTERGGIDPKHSGAAILWTPGRGYEGFVSIKTLRDTLEQRVQDERERWALVEHLPPSRRVPHQRFILGQWQRIDDHLINNRQSTYSRFVLDEIDHLLSMGLEARRFQDCMDALIRRAPPSNLDRAINIARALVNQQALPVWLGMAAPADQRLHAELLEQYRLSAPHERDYLHGITPLREKVRSTLTTLLAARFPEHATDPEHVLITPRIELQGHTQTLTDFAMRHLPQLRAGDIRLASRSATGLPATLDGAAVVQLVRQMDLKSLYQTLFATHLNGKTDDTRERRRRFCRQLPWQLLQYAHEQKLNERLSNAAWRLIQQAFDMPDAVARAAVSGAKALVRPLELIATEGASVVAALGCYLIGAEAADPLVLYAPYSPRHVVKEYKNESELLNEFTSPGALQEWVIGQMLPAHQTTYRNLLRRPNSEIRLAASPVNGNLLHRLFDDNREMLNRMLNCQFTASGQRQWDAFTSLLTKDIPKSLEFMAGKLAYPLVVWRSYTLFEASAQDLQEHRWARALKTFIAGVAQLASLRDELDTLLPDMPAAKQPSALEQWPAASPPKAMTLDTYKVTAPARTRLKTFECQDVALDSLKMNAQTHTYKEKYGARDFVPAAGKVYAVSKAGEHWRLGATEDRGPWIQRNSQGIWVLDLNRHTPRYGKVLSRLADRYYPPTVEQHGINVEAIGMRAISAVSSWKARCINEALNVATYYAVTCKRNILHFAPSRDPLSRSGLFFGDMFGVGTLSPDQLGRIERRIDEVLNELVNPSLITPDSMRFVSGSDRYNPADACAFILPGDAERRIYLMDRFFDPLLDVYQNRLNAPFDIAAHARAATLIHEITHITSDTEDLAYLDSMRPFPDLINVNIKGATQLKTTLTDLRETALSTLTPASMLFRTWDEFSQKWEDFGKSSSSTSLKDKVLSTTGARTLQDARSVFMSNVDKRIDTILANADSITYLITHLGRELDAGA
ncbi:dermonecrotic toxin domain-containing protein [Pseudomonas trivialis]|uniref:Dermonecrotic toxin N-terminal domain-containing protein n=1 Tax=Pseudomonas trivialis TaxID=200450 RepID=A0A0R2ZD09_9PSED|nr:DUF6543 domain-containing protein [Pseudomonas trivialis]KRP58742.1 hypothetical protein TU79_18470 [Pseudomonas trivialis]SDS94512.1 hypothetical protein SAMN04490205_4181 [Pseudomonas trivialis]